MPLECVSSAAPSTGEEVGGALTDERRREILDRLVRDQTREFRAEVVRRGDFEAVLERPAPEAHNRAHLIVTLFLAVLAWAYFAAGQWPSSGPAVEALVVVLPVGSALPWLFLAATGGNERDTFSVDDLGHVQRMSSGPRFERRDNALRVGIPVLVIAVSAVLAVVLTHDLIFQPKPNCPAAVYDSDPCFAMTGMFDDGPVPTGYTLGEFRGITENLRMLGLIFTVLCLLPSLWFLRRMLTGRRVIDVRPINRRYFDEPAPASFPGWDGWLYTGIVVTLIILLSSMLVRPLFIP